MLTRQTSGNGRQLEEYLRGLLDSFDASQGAIVAADRGVARSKLRE